MATNPTSAAVEAARTQLFALADPSYKEFHRKLIPTVDPDAIIGVRTPALRACAKAFAKTPEAQTFMQALPHRYYEENNLHAFLVETLKDFDDAIAALEAFLPHVDNWATCDSMRPRVLKKHPDALYEHIRAWIASGRTYTVRYGIGLLLSFYLDDEFSPVHLSLVAAIESDEYYVNMMRAWYFATALAKQENATLPYIEEGRLDAWTHNKAIQKAIESRRITPEQKDHLRSLKVTASKTPRT